MTKNEYAQLKTRARMAAHNYHDAEDIAQEAAIKIFKYKINPHLAVKHATICFYRREQTQSRCATKLFSQPEQTLDQYTVIEDAEVLRQVMLKMQPHYRRMLLMRGLGCSYEEIAEAEQLKPERARVIVCVARNRIKDVFAYARR